MINAESTDTVPEATQVQILGDVHVSATVRGFYLYSNNGGSPEGLSEFYWHLNGEVLEKEGQLDLKLTGADGSKFLQFSVIPVASDGSRGVERFSPTYKVISGYRTMKMSGAS